MTLANERQTWSWTPSFMRVVNIVGTDDLTACYISHTSKILHLTTFEIADDMEARNEDVSHSTRVILSLLNYIELLTPHSQRRFSLSLF